MQIRDLLTVSGIRLHAQAHTYDDVLELLIGLANKQGHIEDVSKFRAAIYQRQGEGKTLIGMGIDVPHAKSKAVRSPGLCAVTLDSPIDLQAPDGRACDLFFMIAAPEDSDQYMQVLSGLMRKLSDPALSERLRDADDPESFLSILENAGQMEQNDAGIADKSPAILAVTACPTGIAHTYLAAESLEKCAKRRGLSVKVETNGSDGAKNELTKEEIDAAIGIIVAADKAVDTARFDGKAVLFCPVSSGIHKPDALFDRILSGDVPIYHEKKDETDAPADASGEKWYRQIYKHLMNGVSHMLPFVVAGGLFIASAFLIDSLSGAAENADFGAASPVSAFLKGIGGIILGFMTPILSAFISMSIADRPGFLPGFAGGYLAYIGSTFKNPTGDVSAGFLGALLAGFFAGYLMRALFCLFRKIPRALEGLRPVLLYPLLGLLGISLLMCSVNPLMGLIDRAISDWLSSLGTGSKILLGAILGGMMAVDMGGPINKAAYVFGTAAIASENYSVMAAVMIGGMVPPLAIALAVTFFGQKFSREERKSGAVNYVMGLSFITEGAIPYAASDPVRVIPACVLGSAAAGALAMRFGCTLRAPHGGIFVLPAIGHPWLFLTALAVGSALGMILLALFKKRADAPEN